MEIDVTMYVDEVDCALFSASAFELGERVGEITWNNALQHVSINPLIKPEDRSEVVDWFASYGAWDREEMSRWSDADVNALLLQFVAGDVREMEEQCESYEDYEFAAERGEVSGRLYQCPEGKWYYYVGN